MEELLSSIPDSAFTYAWVGLLAYFGVVEAAALLRKEKGDTLSAHVKRWFKVHEKGTSALLHRAGLAAFMVWLTIHFVFP